ncbi:hypothetical protein B0T16DRAFT_314360 [Cercophora newfieldiana]|uniref:Non-canonical purine NTP phosphatase/PRRC1 domain-containing protein n=1 Tax=Cercophora newfieldiana TaxID=92897 RepID=A0AA39YNH9_9PEZI|nr:hypothetical protein B0T16DRAFT_314360 [Cercophora newfieldiana]
MDLLADNNIETIRNTETVVPAPIIETKTIPHFPSYPFPRHGDAILLVIPTANKHKTQILFEAFKAQKPPTAPLHHIVIPADSGVGEQPYDSAGIIGAYNRINNALRALASSPEKQIVLAEKQIGSVIVASIENYIQLAAGASGSRSVDYGVVMVHNATKWVTAASLSKGVTVPEVFVDKARSFGFEDDEGRYGKVTVGSILADSVPGLDKADWHVVLAGRSRYELLREAIDGISIPW